MTSSRILSSLCLGLILVFSTYALFYKLGTEPLQDYDEATYAQVTLEALEHGNFGSLSFLNQPYFRKPPLLFWLTSASVQIFPDTEFGLRVPSALAGLLAILLVMLVCLEAGASLSFALLGGAVLATTAPWMEFARDVRFDTLVSFFILTTFYAGMRASKDARWYVPAGIFLALAVLSKSVIAVFGLFAVFAYLFLSLGPVKTGRQFKNAYFWAGVGVFLLVVLPWHLYETLKYGDAFWHSYLGTEVLHRASTNLFPGGGNPTNAGYLSYLQRFGLPWMQVFVLGILSIPFLYLRMAPRVRSALGASVLTVCAIAAVMFTAQTKALGYLVPLYPFAAVSIALIAAEVWKRLSYEDIYKNAARTGFIFALAMLFFVAGTQTRYNALHLNPYYSWEITQAYDEYRIGTRIAAAPEPVVYTYSYDALGSILYYGRIPESNSPYILELDATSTPPLPGAFVLATSSSSLARAFPMQHFTESYSGRFVSLFTVTD